MPKTQYPILPYILVQAEKAKDPNLRIDLSELRRLYSMLRQKYYVHVWSVVSV